MAQRRIHAGAKKGHNEMCNTTNAGRSVDEGVKSTTTVGFLSADRCTPLYGAATNVQTELTYELCISCNLFICIVR